MAGRSSTVVENYNIACEMNECRWEYKRTGSSRWEPFQATEHKIIELAHILKEKRAQINLPGMSFASRTVVDMRNRSFSRGYGGTYSIRRIVLYTLDEIKARKNQQLIKDFARDKQAKAFADALFDKFKNDPDSDSDSDSGEDSNEPVQEIIEDKLQEFCAEIGVDSTSIQPAILFWQMDVKGFMEITRNEVYLFLQKCAAKTLAAVKNATKNLKSMIGSEKDFASFYKWNFDYYRMSQEQKKFLLKETASQVWNQILVPRFPDLLKHLKDFMAEYKANGVSSDTWKMMLDFSMNTKPDLSDMADYYPPFVDDFVDFLVDNHGYKNPNAEAEEDADEDFF